MSMFSVWTTMMYQACWLHRWHRPASCCQSRQAPSKAGLLRSLCFHPRHTTTTYWHLTQVITFPLHQHLLVSTAAQKHYLLLASHNI